MTTARLDASRKQDESIMEHLGNGLNQLPESNSCAYIFGAKKCSRSTNVYSAATLRMDLTYRRQVKIEQFHMGILHCLLRIAMSSSKTTVTDNIPNTEVLQILLLSAQLRWTGHVICMSDEWWPAPSRQSESEAGACVLCSDHITVL